MNKKILIFLIIAGLAVVFVSTGIYAGTKVDDVFKMETKEYKKHKKGIVEFSHKKHTEEYTNAKDEKLTCGDCHHDDKGKPLAVKMGDDVQRCVECHKETGKLKKGEKKKDKAIIVKYHKLALHANCIDCHKAWNKKQGYKSKDSKAAPQSCKSCHPQKKK